MKRLFSFTLILILGTLWLYMLQGFVVQPYSSAGQDKVAEQFTVSDYRQAFEVYKIREGIADVLRPSNTLGSIQARSLGRYFPGGLQSLASGIDFLPRNQKNYSISNEINKNGIYPFPSMSRSADYYVVLLRRLII